MGDGTCGTKHWLDGRYVRCSEPAERVIAAGMSPQSVCRRHGEQWDAERERQRGRERLRREKDAALAAFDAAYPHRDWMR